jgi:hypothetical protein
MERNAPVVGALQPQLQIHEASSIVMTDAVMQNLRARWTWDITTLPKNFDDLIANFIAFGLTPTERSDEYLMTLHGILERVPVLQITKEQIQPLVRDVKIWRQGGLYMGAYLTGVILTQLKKHMENETTESRRVVNWFASLWLEKCLSLPHDWPDFGLYPARDSYNTRVFDPAPSPVTSRHVIPLGKDDDDEIASTQASEVKEKPWYVEDDSDDEDVNIPSASPAAPVLTKITKTLRPETEFDYLKMYPIFEPNGPKVVVNSRIVSDWLMQILHGSLDKILSKVAISPDFVASFKRSVHPDDSEEETHVERIAARIVRLFPMIGPNINDYLSDEFQFLMDTHLPNVIRIGEEDEISIASGVFVNATESQLNVIRQKILDRGLKKWFIKAVYKELGITQELVSDDLLSRAIAAKVASLQLPVEVPLDVEMEQRLTKINQTLAEYWAKLNSFVLKNTTLGAAGGSETVYKNQLDEIDRLEKHVLSLLTGERRRKWMLNYLKKLDDEIKSFMSNESRVPTFNSKVIRDHMLRARRRRDELRDYYFEHCLTDNHKNLYIRSPVEELHISSEHYTGLVLNIDRSLRGMPELNPSVLAAVDVPVALGGYADEAFIGKLPFSLNRGYYFLPYASIHHSPFIRQLDRQAYYMLCDFAASDADLLGAVILQNEPVVGVVDDIDVTYDIHTKLNQCTDVDVYEAIINLSTHKLHFRESYGDLTENRRTAEEKLKWKTAESIAGMALPPMGVKLYKRYSLSHPLVGRTDGVGHQKIFVYDHRSECKLGKMEISRNETTDAFEGNLNQSGREDIMLEHMNGVIFMRCSIVVMKERDYIKHKEFYDRRDKIITTAQEAQGMGPRSIYMNYVEGHPGDSKKSFDGRVVLFEKPYIVNLERLYRFRLLCRPDIESLGCMIGYYGGLRGTGNIREDRPRMIVLQREWKTYSSRATEANQRLTDYREVTNKIYGPVDLDFIDQAVVPLRHPGRRNRPKFDEDEYFRQLKLIVNPLIKATDRYETRKKLHFQYMQFIYPQLMPSVANMSSLTNDFAHPAYTMAEKARYKKTTFRANWTCYIRDRIDPFFEYTDTIETPSNKRVWVPDLVTEQQGILQNEEQRKKEEEILLKEARERQEEASRKQQEELKRKNVDFSDIFFSFDDKEQPKKTKLDEKLN